jgi:hypothetical protein
MTFFVYGRDGLPALTDVHILDRHLLGSFPAVSFQSVQQRRIGARELVRLIEILLRRRAWLRGGGEGAAGVVWG